MNPMSEKFSKSMLKWRWIKEATKGGADASAMAKVFRNEKTSAPELLAREALQNSWDAIAGRPDQFEMVFRFESYTGDTKRSVAAAFDMSGLATAADDLSMDLPKINSLVNLNDPKKPLKVLYVEDYGALGLRGPVEWQRDSDLYKAIYSLGNSNKNANAGGGSFGFGKAAMFISSKIYCVAAYSAFAPGFPNPHDPNITDPSSRRLVAFVWWNGHSIGMNHFDGRAELLTSAEGRPHEDFVADQVAREMGIKIRDPKQLDQQGTTFAIVDHSVDPEKLVSCIEESWWPAIEHQGLRVRVLVDGKDLKVDPSRRAGLEPFRKAYKIATGDLDLSDDAWRWSKSSPGELFEPFEGLPPGSLGIIRVAPGTLTGIDEDIDAKVALIRNTHMVIGVKEFSSGQQLRGVYIAGDKSQTLNGPDENNWLRKTENAAHTEWNPYPLKEANDVRPWLLAGEVRARIQTAVEYIRALFNKESPDDRVRSSLLAEYLDLSGDGTGTRRKRKKRKKGQFTIEEGSDELRVDPQSPSLNILAERTFTVSLTKKRPTTVQVRITGSCYIVEDGAESTKVPAQVIGEDGIRAEYVVSMTNASQLVFTVKSEPFDRRWSARLDLDAKVISKGRKVANND
jgi:hypothetical protein